MFNENIVEGKWNQVKGQILRTWGKLKDDELDQTKGNILKIAGLVQQKYGEGQEAVRARINSFLKDIETEESSSPSGMDNTDSTSSGAEEDYQRYASKL